MIVVPDPVPETVAMVARIPPSSLLLVVVVVAVEVVVDTRREILLLVENVTTPKVVVVVVAGSSLSIGPAFTVLPRLPLLVRRQRGRRHLVAVVVAGIDQ